MARDGSGNYSRIHNWVTDLANAINITASRHDAEDDSIATALTNSLDRSSGGGGDILRNVGMSNNKFTALGSGSALTDSVNYDDVQSGTILFFGTTGGTSTVYTLAPSPSINAYDTGMRFLLKFNVASGASPTINISAKGAKDLKWVDLSTGTKNSIVADDLETDVIYEAVYDGTDVVIQNFSARVGSTADSGIVPLDKYFIYGLIPSSNAVTPDEQVDVTAGKCVAQDGSTILSLATPTTLDITTHITPSADQTLHAFLYRDTNGDDILDVSTSLTPTVGTGAGNLPDLDGTKYRLIASYKTDGSGDLLLHAGFSLKGGGVYIEYDVPIVDANTNNPSVNKLVTLSIPTGYSIEPVYTGKVYLTSSGLVFYLVLSGGQTATIPSITIFDTEASSVGTGSTSKTVFSNSSGQIRTTLSATAATVNEVINTSGYKINRNQY